MEGYERRDPFADSKKAKQLKQKLQKSNIDLGSGFGGNDAAWITDKQAGWAKVEHAKMQAGFAGRDPGQDWLNAQKLKKYLQRTTLDLDHAGAIATKDWRTDTQHRMEAASDPKYNHLRRDPFADMKKAKQLKQQLQKSTVDLGTGFGGHNTAWITDKQAGWKKFEDAKRAEQLSQSVQSSSPQGKGGVDAEQELVAVVEARQKEAKEVVPVPATEVAPAEEEEIEADYEVSEDWEEKDEEEEDVKDAD